MLLAVAALVVLAVPGDDGAVESAGRRPAHRIAARKRAAACRAAEGDGVMTSGPAILDLLQTYGAVQGLARQEAPSPASTMRLTTVPDTKGPTR